MTNAAAHTPGPWRVLDVFTDLEVVADRATAHETESIVQFKGQRNAKANASLIAAAPLLLESLRTIAGDKESCTCHTRSWYGNHHDTQCPIRIARAAIAAATGG